MPKRRKAGNGNVVMHHRRGRGIDFLGYVFSFNGVRVRKSIKQRFKKKYKVWRTLPDMERKQMLASYWGWFKWANARNLWNKITDNDMSFNQYGISARNVTKDGKRLFDAKQKNIMEVLNLPMQVIDFETDVETQHGKGRFVVLIELDATKETVKFITNSFDIKDELTQAREKEKKGELTFPIPSCVRRKQLSDGKYTFYLE